MRLTAVERRALTVLDLRTFHGRAFHYLSAGKTMADNWHIDLLASELDAVRLGKTHRLILNIPPRYGKSLLASISFPAFVLGHDPSAQILCVSYAQDLSEKLARDCRKLMQSRWYLECFPGAELVGRHAVQECVTRQGGTRLATSIGGVVTGRGADIIIIDDPLKPDEAMSDAARARVNQYYDSTLFSRLNSKEEGAIVLVMQRLHEDDLVGHLLETGQWKVVSLPAIAEADERHEINSLLGRQVVIRRQGEALHPERESVRALEGIKKTLGSYNFSAQYQQRPGPVGGGLVKTSWFVPFLKTDLPGGAEIAQSWDCASKAAEINDYSCCLTFARSRGKVYILDVFRERLEYPDLRRKVIDMAARWRAQTVLIEDAGSGIALLQDLKRDAPFPVEAIKVSGLDKIVRLQAETVALEAGNVHLLADAPWRRDFLAELERFPRGRHDDQVDALSQALYWHRVIRRENGVMGYYREWAEELGVLPRSD